MSRSGRSWRRWGNVNIRANCLRGRRASPIVALIADFCRPHARPRECRPDRDATATVQATPDITVKLNAVPRTKRSEVIPAPTARKIVATTKTVLFRARCLPLSWAASSTGSCPARSMASDRVRAVADNPAVRPPVFLSRSRDQASPAPRNAGTNGGPVPCKYTSPGLTSNTSDDRSSREPIPRRWKSFVAS